MQQPKAIHNMPGWPEEQSQEHETMNQTDQAPCQPDPALWAQPNSAVKVVTVPAILCHYTAYNTEVDMNTMLQVEILQVRLKSQPKDHCDHMRSLSTHFAHSRQSGSA
jgi:hypothetical protein